MDRGPWTMNRFSIPVGVDLTPNCHRRDIRSSMDVCMDLSWNSIIDGPLRGPDHPVRIHPLASTSGYCHSATAVITSTLAAAVYVLYIAQ